jgi:hypothetical protein
MRILVRLILAVVFTAAIVLVTGSASRSKAERNVGYMTNYLEHSTIYNRFPNSWQRSVRRFSVSAKTDNSSKACFVLKGGHIYSAFTV